MKPDTCEHIELRRRRDQSEPEFLADLSHQLHTPLNVMVGYNDMLRDGMFGPLGEEQVEMLQTIRDYSVQLLTTVRHIADLLAAQAKSREAACVGLRSWDFKRRRNIRPSTPPHRYLVGPRRASHQAR